MRPPPVPAPFCMWLVPFPFFCHVVTVRGFCQDSNAIPCGLSSHQNCESGRPLYFIRCQASAILLWQCKINKNRVIFFIRLHPLPLVRPLNSLAIHLTTPWPVLFHIQHMVTPQSWPLYSCIRPLHFQGGLWSVISGPLQS